MEQETRVSQYINPNNYQQGAINGNGNGPSVSLSQLLELILQKTYHDLIVLSEILPRKSDLDRKKDILDFASRSRNLFIRMLALIKWANGASKVEKCGSIMNFLNNQSAYFVDTADQLARMARESLINARLPSFALPIAVDVLTTGTFKRMPACIKNRIVPAEPISKEDRDKVLTRLTHVIEQRLVSQILPKQMRQLKFGHGIVHFHVNHEFRVTLTLMGDSNSVPWRLLNLEILVEDPEIGACRSLVHPLQVNYLKDVVQSRLMENVNPLHDLYNTLHSFCQSLQLEVLYSQAQRLIFDRWGNSVHIEQYLTGNKLTIVYWGERGRSNQIKSEKMYKLTIQVDDKDPSKPLKILHIPPLQGTESTLVSSALKSDFLSLDKLLMHIIQIRSLMKLNELLREFCLILPTRSVISKLPVLLNVPLLNNSTSIENIVIGVDILTGKFVVSSETISSSSFKRLQLCINLPAKPNLNEILNDLKFEIIKKRFELIANSYGRELLTSLPLLPSFGTQKQFSKNSCFVPVAVSALRGIYYLAIEFEWNANLLFTNYSVIKVSRYKEDGTPLNHGHYLKIDRIFGVDDISVKYANRYTNNSSSAKRSAKADEICRSFEPEFAGILSDIPDRLLFGALAQELKKRQIQHTGVILDDSNTHLILVLNYFPKLDDMDDETYEFFRINIVQCKFCIQKRAGDKWIVEILFKENVLKDLCADRSYITNCVNYSFDLNDPIDKVVSLFLKDLTCLAALYVPILRLNCAYRQSVNLQHDIKFNSFTFKKLTFSYGPSKSYCASIVCKSNPTGMKLLFGCSGQSSSANPHNIALAHLQKQLEETNDLIGLVQILSETCDMYMAVSKLNTCLHMTTFNEKPTQIFSVVVQSTHQLRILYQNTFALDIIVASNNQGVYVRDAQLHHGLSTSIQTIPQLYSFLNKYVDDAVLPRNRQLSIAEDDRPLSPLYDSSFSRLQQDLSMPSTPPNDLNTPGSPGFSQSPGVSWRNEVTSNIATAQKNQQPKGVLSTLLSYQALSRLMTPGPPPSGVSHQINCSALERFLACAGQRRKIKQIIEQKSEMITILQTSDRFSTIFKSDQLTYKISLDQQHMQVLCFQILSSDMIQLDKDEISALERLFDTRVACPPYKMHSLTSFMTLLCVPVRILKDIIQIIRMEVSNDGNAVLHGKLCMTFPVCDNNVEANFGDPGKTTIVLSGDRNKCLFSIEFSLNHNNPSISKNLDVNFVLSLVFDATMNRLTMVNKPPMLHSSKQIIQQFFDQIKSILDTPRQINECSLIPCYKDIIYRLNINNFPQNFFM